MRAQFGDWLEATLTSLEGAKHMLDAYFRIGLDDQVDDFLIRNVRHAEVRTTSRPREPMGASDSKETMGSCANGLSRAEIFSYAVRRTPPWRLVTLERLQAWAPMTKPGQAASIPTPPASQNPSMRPTRAPTSTTIVCNDAACEGYTRMATNSVCAGGLLSAEGPDLEERCRQTFDGQHAKKKTVDGQHTKQPEKGPFLQLL